MIEIFEKYKVAIEAALAASEEILHVYAGSFERIEKEDGSPVTEADYKSSEVISTYLETTKIPITGEESTKSPFEERKHWPKVWCVDPLDGTKEFIKKNGEFVINIALIEHQEPIFGLIASPTQQKMIIGGRGLGAYKLSYNDALNPSKWTKLNSLSKVENPVHIVSSRSHYSGNLLDFANSIEQEYGSYASSNMGSALKFFELVTGRADVYPRFAPTMEWDIAAGQAIFEEVGGKLIGVDTGKPLIYNKEDLHNPYFIAYNPYLKIFDQ